MSQGNGTSEEGFKGHRLSPRNMVRAELLSQIVLPWPEKLLLPAPNSSRTHCSSVGRWWLDHAAGIDNSLDACPAGEIPFYTTSTWTCPIIPGDITSRTKPESPKQGKGPWTQCSGDKKALDICPWWGKGNNKSESWTKQAQTLLRGDSG